MAVNTLSTLQDPDWLKLFKILENNDVSEAQVNGRDSVWIKLKGKRIKIPDIRWGSDKEYAESVENALGRTGFISSDVPFNPQGALFEGPVEFKTDSGKLIKGRAHIVLPPASDVPQLTFAKKTANLVTLDAIAEGGSLSYEMLRFLKAAVYSDLTTVLSGGTGSGKTTMMEACTKLMAPDERIGVCEDTPELVLKQENVAYLHSLPWRPGMDEKDVATLSWCVQQINRMRTDRVLVGETRGKEFADFLIAANSGMDGSMTTIHANDPAQCLSKMSNFALKGAGENVTMRAINQDIANTIDLIIQIGYEKESGRYYTYSITEVRNTVNEKTNQITTGTLYKLDLESKTHVKVDPPSDVLRAKMRASGIDVSEFVGQSKESGMEPKWLPGFGPESKQPKKERTFNKDKRITTPESNSRQKRGGLNGNRRSI